MNQTDYETDSSPRVWKILAGVFISAILLLSIWNCNVNRDERISAEKTVEQQRMEITRLVGEVEKANDIIRDAYADIERLNREVDKANQVIQQQNVILECYARKSNNTELISFITNLMAPGLGGAVGSVLGQQQEC